MTRRRRPLGLVGLLALLLLAASCGSSGGSSEGSGEASDPTTTTSGSSSGTDGGADDDAAMMGEFLDRYRPGLELVFEGDQLDCVLQAFEESALGDSSDQAVMAAYEGCGTSAQAVTGAMLAAQLLEGGVADDGARCVAEAIGRLDADEVDALTDAAGNQIYADCGVDPSNVGG